MMKKIILLLTICVGSQADPYSSIGTYVGNAPRIDRPTAAQKQERLHEIFKDPFRKFGSVYLDLRLKMSWIAGNCAGRDPMPAVSFAFGHVRRLEKTGILIEKSRDNFVYIRNFPEQGIADGDYVRVIAKSTGETQKVKDVHGVMRAVAAFDYGKPFTPVATHTPAREPAKVEAVTTNAPHHSMFDARDYKYRPKGFAK